MTGCQQFHFSEISSTPYRSDHVNHESYGQVMTTGDFHVSRTATTETSTFPEKTRPGCPVNGTINPASIR